MGEKESMKFKNRRISVSIGKTINTGDYNSFKIDAGMEADVSNKADLDKAYTDLFEEVESQVATYEEDVFNKEEDRE